MRSAPPWGLEIRQEAEALELTEETLAQWRGLAELDPKPTWFQGPEFVLPWYRIYRARFAPHLVLGRAKDGTLLGVLAAAVDRSTGELVHAGTHHATYHGWIADPRVEGEFPRRAVEALFGLTEADQWIWRHLPPGAPVFWVDRRRSPAAPHEARISTVPLPVWNLGAEPELPAGSRKKRLRKYANAYARRDGPLTLRRVTDPEDAKALLERAAGWVDVRIGAKEGERPFADDPDKLAFHLAWAQAGERHVLHVLETGGRPIVLQLDSYDRGRLCLGLHAYDPTEGRSSPGTLMLLELARTLVEDGAQEIDLTPGYDGWKFAFATDYRDGHAIEFFRSTTSASRLLTRRRVQREAVRLARRLGQEPHELASRASQVTTHARALRRRATLSGLEPALFELEVPDVSAPPPPHAQAVLSALSFLGSEVETGPTSSHPAQDALHRLGRGEEPAIALAGEELRVLAWLTPEPKDATLGDLSAARRPVLRSAEARARLPAGVGFAVVTFEAEDATEAEAEVALARLYAQARRAGVVRLWVLAPTEPRVRAHLASRGRMVDLRDQRTGPLSADQLSAEEIAELKRMEANSRDRGADDYLELTRAQEGEFQLQAEEQAILRRLDAKPGDRVLDAGVGVGRFALLLAPRVQRVVGLDLSSRCLEHLDRGAAKHGYGNVSTVQADLCRYEPEERFDKAACLEVLQHVPSHAERLEAARRLRRALVPGGTLVVTTVAWNRRAHGDKETIRGEGEGALYFHSFAPEELGALLEEAGFRDVSVRGLITLPRRITRRLPTALTRLEVLASRVPGTEHLGAFLLAHARA